MTRNHDKGLAELERLALAQTHIAAKGPSSSARRLILALGPLYAVKWVGEALAIVCAEKYASYYAFSEAPTWGRELH